MAEAFVMVQPITLCAQSLGRILSSSSIAMPLRSILAGWGSTAIAINDMHIIMIFYIEVNSKTYYKSLESLLETLRTVVDSAIIVVL